MHTNPFTAAGYDLSNLERQIQQKADRHEIHTLRGEVDRLERSLHAADSTSAGLRDRCERLEEDFRRLNEQLDMLRAVVEDEQRGETATFVRENMPRLREAALELRTPTEKLVDRFAAALKEKLRAAEQKYGFSNDWMKDDWRGELIAKLLSHVQKGDPRDVAAYCAFAWHHEWSITPPQAEPRRAIRELKLIATAETDLKVREGIDRAIQHLESMMEA
jgi:hypothetical protein